MDRRTGQSFPERFQTRKFDVATPGEFKHFRLNITANHAWAGLLIRYARLHGPLVIKKAFDYLRIYKAQNQPVPPTPDCIRAARRGWLNRDRCRRVSPAA